MLTLAGFALPESELELSYVRSSGPGGQNVNKVNSKAVLRWCPLETTALPAPVRARFLSRFAHRLTVDGFVVISCDLHRDRERNRRECLLRLERMLEEAARPPRPRVKTKVPRSQKKRRREDKRARSKVKKARTRNWRDE